MGETSVAFKSRQAFRDGQVQEMKGHVLREEWEPLRETCPLIPYCKHARTSDVAVGSGQTADASRCKWE